MRTTGHILSLVLLAAATAAFGQNTRRADFDAGKNIEIFFNVYRGVNTQYVDSVDNRKLIEAAAEKMLSSLDPYTEYFNEEEMKEFRVHTTGQYGGVGSLVRKDSDTDYIRISEPYRDSPADRAGLRPGDLIVAIDGVSMKGIKVDTVSARMKGVPGSSFVMTVRDGATGSERDVEIKRERIKIPAVSYAGFVNDSIGYVSLDSFSDGCAADVRRYIADMKRSGRLKGLILDLRGNGGGLLDEAVALTGLFVPKGTEVVSIKGRVEAENALYKTTNEPIDTDLPLVVMVNSASASSSEIVAGALQDLDRAVVYGTRTFGKGLVQSTMSVGYGSYMKITTAKYYIPSGRCIQAVDYSHRNEDGSVGNIPDSLMREFRTAAGRIVRDGGGITPDIAVKPEYAGKFATALVAYGYIDDYAVKYYNKHRDIDFDPLAFRMSDDEYADFCRFIEGKELEYTSATQIELNKLKSIARKEDYSDKLAPMIEQIEAVVKADKKRDLALYKEEILEYLESAITADYAYAWGRSQRAVANDPHIDEAAALAGDRQKLDSLLH
ncbi:MAG: S41 family peptidase [Rikenellaceae bacterium]|nr:S41 family peptidase [Rikenellaceae bacterium]